MLPQKFIGENLSLLWPNFWCLWAIVGIPWLVNASFQSCLHIGFSLCLCLFSWHSFYDTSHLGEGPTPPTYKGPSSQGYGFSSSHVWMWELNYKESWAPKNWCFWTVMEKTLESPLDCKESKPVNSKGNQSWIFIGRTDGEAETPILWPPDVKNWFIGKDPDAGKDWRWEDKGTTEDEMIGWHH